MRFAAIACGAGRDRRDALAAGEQARELAVVEDAVAPGRPTAAPVTTTPGSAARGAGG